MMAAFKFIVAGAAKSQVRRFAAVKPANFGNNLVTHSQGKASEPK